MSPRWLALLLFVVASLDGDRSVVWAEAPRTVTINEWGKIGVVKDSISRIMPFEEQVRVLKSYHECQLRCCCERGMCCWRLVPAEIIREETEIATRDRRFVFAPPLECWLGKVTEGEDGKGAKPTSFAIQLIEQLTLFDPNARRFQGSVRSPDDRSVEVPAASYLSAAWWGPKNFGQASVPGGLPEELTSKYGAEGPQVLLIWNLAHDLQAKSPFTIKGVKAGGQTVASCKTEAGKPVECNVLRQFAVDELKADAEIQPNDYVRIVFWEKKDGKSAIREASVMPSPPGPMDKNLLEHAFDQVKDDFLIEQEFRVSRKYEEKKSPVP